jgi:DnaJ-class molecular chaperone
MRRSNSPMAHSVYSMLPRKRARAGRRKTMTFKEGIQVIEKESLECAFCHGRGRDPFDLLSDQSVCQVCGGKGRVAIGVPFRECAYCKGTGVHPQRRMVCTVCGGKGVVKAREDAKTCADCLGRGCVPGQYLPCLTCGGKGVVGH